MFGIADNSFSPKEAQARPLKMYSSVPPSMAAPRYRNNSTDIAGTARSRLISGVEMQRILFILRSCGMRHRRSALISLYLPWHKPHASPTRARFSQPIFSEILGSRSIRQIPFLAAAARFSYKKIRWRQKSHGSLAFSAAGRSAP